MARKKKGPKDSTDSRTFTVPAPEKAIELAADSVEQFNEEEKPEVPPAEAQAPAEEAGEIAPLIPPSDEELVELQRKVLASADVEERTIKRVLDVPLNDADIRELAFKAAAIEQQMGLLEIEASESHKAFKKRIDGLGVELSTTLAQVRNSHDRREVECIERKTFSTNQVEYLYDGKVCESRTLHPSEKQGMLFDQPGTVTPVPETELAPGVQFLKDVQAGDRVRIGIKGEESDVFGRFQSFRIVDGETWINLDQCPPPGTWKWEPNGDDDGARSVHVATIEDFEVLPPTLTLDIDNDGDLVVSANGEPDAGISAAIDDDDDGTSLGAVEDAQL